MNTDAMLWAEFETGAAAVSAARRLREHGFERLDAITPYPLPELEETLGLGRPRLLLALVLGAACTGGALAYLLMWWTAAVSYPLDVGGRPLNSFVTDIPIIFETSVLSAAVTAFVATLVLSGMPRLDHPLDGVAGFDRTSIDRFWIGIDRSRAPDLASLPGLLEELGASRLHAPADSPSPSPGEAR